RKRLSFVSMNTRALPFLSLAAALGACGTKPPPADTTIPPAPPSTATSAPAPEAPHARVGSGRTKLEFVGPQPPDYPGVLVVHGTILGRPTLLAVVTATARYLEGGVSVTDRFLVETAKVADWGSLPDQVAHPAITIDGWGALPDRGAAMSGASNAYEV